MIKIEVTWSDGRITVEQGHNPCINQPEFTPESLYKYLCTIAAWNKYQPQPVSFREV